MKSTIKKYIKQLGLPFLIIGGSLVIGSLLIFTKPTAKKQSQTQEIPLVETIVLKKTSTPLQITAQGHMEPSESIRLLAEVSGKVIFVHPGFTNGGLVKQGDLLIRIDPKDYELALAQKESILASAKLNLSLETAQQEVAQDEYARRVEGDLSENAKALATRTSFLEKAKAEYKAALAEVQRAKLLLLKTQVKAPLNAMVAKASVHTGEYIFTQGEIGVLFGNEEFKAEVNVPIHELANIQFANTKDGVGSKAIVSQISMNDTSIEREGVVTKLLPELGSLGHMAQVIVTIKDPLGLYNKKALPLLAKAKVNVLIEGITLNDVFIVPRNALLENDTVLVVDIESKVERVKLNIVRREKDFVLATGDDLQNKPVIITKSNNTLVGQPVRLANAP